MPEYRYKCKQCGKEFDVSHGFEQQLSDVIDLENFCKDCNCSQDNKCEDCSCKHTNDKFFKVIGNVGVVYKGSGFTKVESANAASGIPASVWENHQRLDS